MHGFESAKAQQLLAFAMPLLTSVAWSGPVTGSVAFGYDDNFRLANETVTGNSIAYSYDPDALLTGSGLLTLQRNPQNGFLTDRRASCGRDLGHAEWRCDPTSLRLLSRSPARLVRPGLLLRDQHRQWCSCAGEPRLAAFR